MTCACGHEYDEHDDNGVECCVEDCDCIHFERGDVRFQAYMMLLTVFCLGVAVGALLPWVLL